MSAVPTAHASFFIPLQILHLATTHIPDLHQIHASEHRLHAPLRQSVVVVLHVLRQRVSRLFSTPFPVPTLVASLLRQRFVSGVRLHHSFTAYAFSSCGLSRFVCTPWTSVRTSRTCPSDSVNFRYRYMRLIFSGFYASPAEFDRTSSGNGDGNSQFVTSEVMICFAKSRLMSVTSFLPLSPLLPFSPTTSNCSCSPPPSADPPTFRSPRTGRTRRRGAR